MALDARQNAQGTVMMDKPLPDSSKEPPRLQLHISTVDYKRKDPVFWIEATSTLTKYKHKYRRIPRYFSDLERLYHHLVATCDDAFIPALPPCPHPHYDKDGNMYGHQWWIQVLNGNPVNNEKTTAQMQRWLNRIASHERICMNEGLREFVESEIGFHPQEQRKRHVAMPKALNVRREDLDPEFWQLSEQLDIFYTCLQNTKQVAIHESINKFADAWMDLSSAWVAYGAFERHPQLFITCKTMSRGCRQLHGLERLQSFAATETIDDQVAYQLQNTKNVQDIMQRRLDAVGVYFGCRRRTESSMRHVERLRASSNIDRQQANEAIAELDYARRAEQDALQTYDRIDRHYQQDIDQRYIPQTAADMVRALKQYAQGQLFIEKQKLAVWENMLSELKHE